MITVRETLESELRSIYDDDAFARCVISQAVTEENWQIMVDYINKARETDEPATYEDMVALSLVLREQLDRGSGGDRSVSC